MNEMNKWEGGSTLVYAASIASTWAWAPALFISGAQAYNNGLAGFLMFFLPNALTLFLFGLFAYFVRTHYPDGNSVTIENMLRTSGKQTKIHMVMTVILIFCSCCMQLMGIFMVIDNYFNSRILTAVVVLLIALWTTKNGIKSCIRTDLIKYFLIIAIGFFLLTQIDYSNISLAGHTSKSVTEIATSFGIPTVLGLLTAPYIDSTFVQRMYCISKDKLVKTFGLAALLFALIPLIYGIFGFAGIKDTSKFFTGFNGVLLLIAVLAALMSTLDSNLCALEAIINDYTSKNGKFYIVLFYVLVAWIMINPPMDITGLFTLYCTIRCTMFFPTCLIVMDRYDKNRLFYASIISCLVSCFGYLMTADFCFTLFGLFFPILGYKRTGTLA